jgi:NAD(P)-dependent dehydrogenase (short-subunit alcohol dehydrogenase family)
MPKIPARARSVVTGAGSGFGRAISLELAARGSRVLCSDIDLGTAEETAAMIRARGVDAHAVRTDVRDAAQVEALAAKSDELWGGTDVLVNNAGVAVAGAVGEIPLEDWRWQIDINLYGVIYGCHAFVPRMKKQNAEGKGHAFILNVASSAGLLAAPMMGPYNVTKAGVIALSETLYTELAKDRISVSALCPTFFRTNIHKNARAAGMDAVKARTEKLVTEAKWSAEEIAQHALRGLEHRALYIIPQTDGKALWRMKRALGDGFYRGIGALAKRGLLDRL